VNSNVIVDEEATFILGQQIYPATSVWNDRRLAKCLVNVEEILTEERAVAPSLHEASAEADNYSLAPTEAARS